MSQEADALAMQAEKSTVSFYWPSPMLLDKKFMKAKQIIKVFANKYTV